MEVGINWQKDFSRMTPEDKEKYKNLIEFLFAEDNIVSYLEDRTFPQSISAT
jgi:hypothetical protein